MNLVSLIMKSILGAAHGILTLILYYFMLIYTEKFDLCFSKNH